MVNVAVPRAWEGETVVIMATGPSLCQSDVDYVRGKARVIAVNDAHRLAPWADVLYSSDQLWWPHHKGVPSFAGAKYGIRTRARRPESSPFPKHPDIIVLNKTGAHGLELDPTGLRHGQNSGYAAINLAVHFGVRRILLLGYNMSMFGGKRHFFGNHVGLSNNIDYQACISAFATLVGPLKSAGVEVINCTKHTHLHVFPEADLRAVLTDQGEAVAC